MARPKAQSIAAAALSLPLLGTVGATYLGQAAAADPTPSIASATRSSTAMAEVELAVAGQPLAVNFTTAAEVESDTGIDPMRGWSEDNLASYEAWWDAGYNYAQLLVLAEEWNLSEFEAKAQAGAAILAGDTSSFDSVVAGIAPTQAEVDAESADDGYDDPAQDQVDVFFDAGYTYDDAVVLGEEWNIDPYEAKITAGGIITDGNADQIESILA